MELNTDVRTGINQLSFSPVMTETLRDEVVEAEEVGGTTETTQSLTR